MAQAEANGQLDSLRNYLEQVNQLDQLTANPFASISPSQVAELFGQIGAVPNQGVLADTMRGGLRRDLTRGLDTSLSLSDSAEAQAEIGAGVAVLDMPEPGYVGRIAPQNTWTPRTEPPAPTWDVVRSYTDSRAGASQSINPVFAPFPVLDTWNISTSPTHAVMPIVTMFEVRYGVDISGTNYRYVLQPTIILCNPYNVALNEADYSIIYEPRGSGAPGALFKVFNGSKTPYKTLPEVSFVEHLGSSTLAFNLTDSFEPGEVKIYSLPADREFTDADQGIVELAPGFHAGLMLMDSGEIIEPALTAEGSVAKLEIHDVDSYNPRLSVAGGHSSAGSYATPSLTSRNLEMESKQMDIGKKTFPPHDKQAKPSAWMENASSASHHLITFRHSLSNAANDYLMSGNQPGQHDVPSDHPAYTSWGGTEGELNAGTRMFVDGNPCSYWTTSWRMGQSRQLLLRELSRRRLYRSGGGGF